MKKIGRVLFTLLIFLTSCTKPLFDDGYIRYSTNYNYTIHPVIAELDDYVKIAFIVNDSWYYETEHNGWSKIFGYSDGSVYKNSNRLVFQCRDGVLYAGYYFYINGVSPQENTKQKGTLLELVSGKKYIAEIYRDNGDYCIDLYNESQNASIRFPAGKNKIGVLLFPHIGGSYTINGFYIDLKIY